MGVTVEDIPEEDCDTAEAVDSPVDDAISGVSCLEGSWSAPLSTMRSSLIADSLAGQKIGSVSGTMTMTLEPDGTMTSGINWLRVRSLAPFGSDPDRVLTTMVWDGGGSGTWSADETTFTTKTALFTLDSHIVSRLDGEVIINNSQDLAAEQTGAFRGDGSARYLCVEDRLITESAGGGSAAWVRANKANTIPKS